MSTSSPLPAQWLKVLTKGMVTLPKSWREEFGLTKGSVIQATKRDRTIILKAADPAQSATVPYRIYTRTELNEFVNDDQHKP